MLPLHDRSLLRTRVKRLHDNRIMYHNDTIKAAYTEQAKILIREKIIQLYNENKEVINSYNQICNVPQSGGRSIYIGDYDIGYEELTNKGIPYFYLNLDVLDVPGLHELDLKLHTKKQILNDSINKFNEIIRELMGSFSSTKYLAKIFPELIPFLDSGKIKEPNWLPNPITYRKYKVIRDLLEENGRINDLIVYLGQAHIEGTIPQ